jgi:aldehyde:ferredoxin oxidoreductase
MFPVLQNGRGGGISFLSSISFSPVICMLGGGFTGRMLRIDVSSGRQAEEKLDWARARMFLGSKGYAAQLLYRELAPGTGPLSPQNKLVIMTGPLTGVHGGPMPNRFSVSTRSPLTGTWVDSHCGGDWGPELKFAGWDGMILEGRADSPVHIRIRNSDVELASAEQLWGKGTFETMRLIQDDEKAAKRPRVLSIGPAGEKLSPMACVIADVRAAGRGGTGAVLGSKNVKAISVVGTNEVPLADAAAFSELAKQARGKLLAAQSLKDRMLEGTAGNVRPVNVSGGLPTRNFQEGRFEAYEQITGDMFGKHFWNDSKNLKPCWSCITPCAHFGKLPAIYGGVVDEGPEYETVVLNGSNLGISDRDVIAYADYLMDDSGLDTISFGNTLGFIIECFERGLIGKTDTGGTALRFGDPELLLRAIPMAALREGPLGALLADGVRAASSRIGKGSADFAMHVKGLEIPAYDPRGSPAQALAYAVSDRGACHLRPFMYGSEHFGKSPRLDPTIYDGKAREVKSGQERNALTDALGICKFYAYGLSLTKDMLPLINAATGFGYSQDEFLLVGERINNLTRMFNVREGFDARHDRLPQRCMEPLHFGRRAGMSMDAGRMLPEYYRECGWDDDGVPTEEKLLSLGLDLTMPRKDG